jgi:hypothetical protein
MLILQTLVSMQMLYDRTVAASDRFAVQNVIRDATFAAEYLREQLSTAQADDLFSRRRLLQVGANRFFPQVRKKTGRRVLQFSLAVLDLTLPTEMYLSSYFHQHCLALLTIIMRRCRRRAQLFVDGVLQKNFAMTVAL